MSEQQSQTAADTPTEPTLCKMNCGFFGNGATGDCCSKCWLELQKKLGKATEIAPPSPAKQCVTTAAGEPEQEPQPMDVEHQEIISPKPAFGVTEAPGRSSQPSQTPKKTKKTSYKNMISTMLQGTPSRDVEKEKEELRKVTGGGVFSKVEKI